MNAPEDYIKDWIDKADHDLGSAKLIFLHLPGYSDTIAFHCQQAVEKYIKAIVDQYDKAILLNGFSVQIRYPDQIIYLTKEELETSIAIAQEFRNFATKMLSIE